MTGDVIIEQSGSLNSLTKYKFARLDGPNIDVYNFKLDNELAADRSDRLAIVLSSNYNRNRDIVNDVRLPSHLSLSGFNTHYDYDEHVYIATSCIPPWWQDIISYPAAGQSIPANDLKKVSFKNQKNVCRWLKEAILYSTPRHLSSTRKNKKSLGLQVDAIQLNSYKGNTVNYGYLDRFSIIGGNYGISYVETSGIATSIDTSKNPLFSLKEGTTTQLVSNSNNLTRISGSISKINFNQLFTEYQSELSGFTEQPTIEVVNQNPQIVINFTNISASGDAYPGLSISGSDPNVITSNSHGLKTLDKIKFISDNDYFQSLISNTEYFVRVFDVNKFALYKTKSQALLNDGRVSLKPNYVDASSGVPVATSNVTFKFESPIKNPFSGFEQSLLELSYKDGNIDNIIIRKSGKGYINLPKIIIKGGGKPDFEVPFSKNLVKFVEMSGPLVSYYDYDNKNYNISYVNTVNYPSLTTNTFKKSPTVDIIDGRNGEGVSFVSDGKITSVVVTNSGEYYYATPTIEVVGTGKDAVIEVTTSSDGRIQKFDVINPGSGYTSAPEIKIIPAGSGGLVTALLKEWTFNLVRQLKALDRVDNYGGYVFDSGDAIPSSNNPESFKLIDYKNDFPKDLDQKQYFLLKPSNKLAARQVKNAGPEYLLQQLATASGTTKANLTDDQLLGISSSTTAIVPHSLAVSYDGIPIYDGTKVLTKRNEQFGPLNQLVEAVSQYKLKHSTSTNGGSYYRITLNWDFGVFNLHAHAAKISYYDKASAGDGDSASTIIPYTISFSEQSKGWTSFKSWIQETGISLNDRYFTFKSGELYEHHTNETRNTFYGLNSVDSTLCLLFNEMPSSVKNFSSLSYEGSQSRIIENTTDGEYYNNTSVNGWYAESIETDLEKGFIPEFRDKEGKWINFIKGNEENTLANLNVKQFSVQGIGTPTTVATTVVAPAPKYKFTIQDIGDQD